MTTLRQPLVDQVQAIRRAVAARHGVEPGTTPDVSASSAIERAQRFATVSAHWGLSSGLPVVGPLIVLAQRALRIGLRWYINPIVEQQNAFNDAAVAALYELELENQRLRRMMLESADSGNEHTIE
ncbi:MAG: hypothetical protein M9890_01025 [Thermomicrobiales bacterium]|nr:hypothetical protein [Thermomicrobiales bacterium]